MVVSKNLFERKEDVIRLIDEKGMLTDDLKQSILKAEKLVDVEDFYRPFKEKKKRKQPKQSRKDFKVFLISSCIYQKMIPKKKRKNM